MPLGGVLLVLAISAMLLALNQLQRRAESVWSSPRLACVLATAGFVAQERRAPRPIIDLRFFRDVDFSLLNAGHAALNLAGFSVLLLVPFYLSRFGGLSPYATGLAAGVFARRHGARRTACRTACDARCRRACSR